MEVLVPETLLEITKSFKLEVLGLEVLGLAPPPLSQAAPTCMCWSLNVLSGGVLAMCVEDLGVTPPASLPPPLKKSEEEEKYAKEKEKDDWGEGRGGGGEFAVSQNVGIC